MYQNSDFCLLLQDPAFDGLAPKKIGASELNKKKKNSNLGILTMGKCKNLASFLVFKLCRHLPFLLNLDYSFMAPLFIKLAENIIGLPSI